MLFGDIRYMTRCLGLLGHYTIMGYSE
jgi:hypothetical protein